jgi:UPF0271 protein
MLKVDVNCDMGESYGVYEIGNDAALMPFISSANIACGFHAGDPTTIARTISLAKANKVAVGAHPGFPDLMGFGRREMQLTPEETRDYMIYQIGAIQAFATIAGVELQHVKPHGALYNMASKDGKLSKTLVEAVQSLGEDLIVFAPTRSELAKNAVKAGLRVAQEFFADRAYDPNGNLASRKEPKSVLTDPKIVAERAVRAITEKTVVTTNGAVLSIGDVDTVCVHGDNASAPVLVRVLNKRLKNAGIKMAPVGTFL